MTNQEDEKQIKELLQQEFASFKNAELGRDLWPQMLQRLAQPPMRVPWFDWALAAILGAVLIFFPGAIPALLYHM